MTSSPERASQRKIPEEKGPFGRSTRRRGTSRSKTTTPAGRKEDRDRLEDWKVIDDIFNRVKEKDTPSQRVGREASTEAGPQQPQLSPPGVATEVILYGFPAAYQYAAIEFYERVSEGNIYEDYERYPPNSKYDLSLSRSAAFRKPRNRPDVRRKVNMYHGGEHWIKVTFDSAEAAERACYYSPHTLNGHIVIAEPYRGTGPAEDVAILATEEALNSVTASPSQKSTSTVQPHQVPLPASSSTASSATAAGHSSPTISSPANDQILTQSTNTLNHSTATTATALAAPAERPLRVRGAKRAVLLPAEAALLPARSRWQRTFGNWPLIGFFMGGASANIVGDEVPRKNDGTFDWERASVYWKFWALLDFYLWFANFCGLKDDD
jgi:hypothetical protein